MEDDEAMPSEGNEAATPAQDALSCITLFLCGDVMTGRGVDQVLPHPGDPTLFEPAAGSATSYLSLAEQRSGSIPRCVPFKYIWGDAISELERVGPDLRIVNLETAVTKSNECWKDKDVHYRMNPENAPCFTAAGIDCCVLANNHVLDWGYSGLEETLQTLEHMAIATAGAGRNLRKSHEPAIFEFTGGRVLVFAFGSESSGIPSAWLATDKKPGVSLIDEAALEEVSAIRQRIESIKRDGDVVVVSIHWGPNWGYGIPREQRGFAHSLVDHAGVDVIHGHSSHHVKGLEVYRGKPIIYGCGDFLSDYEGIKGYEAFRDDLGLMYFVSMNPASGKLAQLHMRPTQIKRFQVRRCSSGDASWLAGVLNREGRKLGTHVDRDETDMLTLQWD